MQSNTEIKYIDSNGNNCSPLPIIETTITDPNNLPLKSGIYRNTSSGFGTISYNNNVYLYNEVKQEVPDISSNGGIIIFQEAYVFMANIMPIIFKRFGYQSPLGTSISWSGWNYSIEGSSIVAGKLGTATKGSPTNPIYLMNGTPYISTSTVGSATKPIYMNAGTLTEGTYTLGAACEKGVSDSTSANALSSTDTNVPTVRDIYYGMPTINGTKASMASIYAPTSAGANGQIIYTTSSGLNYTYPARITSFTYSSSSTAWQIKDLQYSSTERLRIMWKRVTSSGSSAKHENISWYNDNSVTFKYTPHVFTTYGEIGNTSSVSNMYGWLSAISTTGCTVRSYGGCDFWILVIGLVNANA